MYRGKSQPVSWDMREIGVTCSFGVAWTRAGVYNLGQLLQEADAALYRAKTRRQKSRGNGGSRTAISRHDEDAPAFIRRWRVQRTGARAQFVQFLERYPQVKEQNRCTRLLLRSQAYRAGRRCRASARW